MARVEHWTFQCNKQTFDAIYLDCVTRKLGLVIRKTYVILLEEAKELCKGKFPIIWNVYGLSHLNTFFMVYVLLIVLIF
jgi:hypothetical protein